MRSHSLNCDTDNLFDDPDVEESIQTKAPKLPSKKRDRVLDCEADGDLFDEYKTLSQTDRVNDVINLLPICYVGNKKRVLRPIWHFLEAKHVEFNSVFDAFSGSGVFSFMSLLMNKSVTMNDVMSYPSLLAVSLLGNKSYCPTNKQLQVIMGEDLCPTNNIHIADQWEGLFFTKEECDFLNRFRSNLVTMYGHTVYAGHKLDGTPKLISLIPGKEPESSIGMLNNAFFLYLLLTLLHQLCFTGGRYFRRQIIAKLDYRLQHIRNKGAEIHARPMDFMWLKEVRKFLDILSTKVDEGDSYHEFISEDIIDVLSSNQSPSADLLYLDPPYGGMSSNYLEIYRLFEEYIYGVPTAAIPHLAVPGNRFKSAKGYREQFEEVLSLCGDYPSWLISYNAQSFSSVEEITKSIKRFRNRVDIMDTDIKYRYRKGTGKSNEFTILAR